VLDVVVEGGFGNASQRFYLPALKAALGKGVRRIFLADVREYPPELSTPTAPNIITLLKNDPGGKRLYEQLSPHVVFVVTPPGSHLRVAARWLHKSRHVCVEKPAAADPLALERFLERARALEAKVYFFDHYRARTSSILRGLEADQRHDALSADTIQFSLFDPKTIEDQSREEAFSFGVVFDLLSHFLAIADYLYPGARVIARDVRGGIYYYPSETSARRYAATDYETLAVTGGTLATLQRSVAFSCAVGVGLGKRSDGGLTTCKEMRLRLSAPKAESLYFDMNSSAWKLSKETDEEQLRILELEESPYGRLVQFFLGSSVPARDLFLSDEAAVALVSTLKQLSAAVNAKGLGEYAAYSEVSDVLRLAGT
jgi:hypothetical protein